ncbi:hypothetical protein MA16_Dca029121 [Dendrobium catenatum]|uniref:Uncharacterized protein n=1 Tax=Dendrobium catenatum TaxID=906689 RepID=A0A2I0VCZ4_9ASPA|nr:hypothetical protein MA16_Dca029121 [Dendrobium catenatum]
MEWGRARGMGASASVDLRLREATSRARSGALIGFDSGGRSRREWERSYERKGDGVRSSGSSVEQRRLRLLFNDAKMVRFNGTSAGIAEKRC